MDNYVDQQLALAGVCQSAFLVKNLARTGKVEPNAFEASIESIVVTDANDTVEIFGGLSGLQAGIATLENQLNNKSGRKDSEITRYIADILGLERKLTRNTTTLNTLGQRIEHIKRQRMHSELFEAPMIANLASVYKDVISPLGSKIQVAGSPDILKQAGVQDKVRAVLLAGIRSAVLWRQLGGKRRNIIFQRNKILKVVHELVRQFEESK
ncbi:high frequency lysogenization protein HflD [Alteromonas sp. a30]|uniref:high frequency lysogenization protein HflD n=1 Tax=Alteromonas sp. a30 TaxID=2730917 RepID=UPI003FA35471|nr:high frequency lysogenization protein HflD [Alteromonas sp. a30]